MDSTRVSFYLPELRALSGSEHSGSKRLTAKTARFRGFGSEQETSCQLLLTYGSKDIWALSTKTRSNYSVGDLQPPLFGL